MQFYFTDTAEALMIVDTLNGETHSIPMSEEFRYKKAKSAVLDNDFNELEKILYPDKHFSLPGFELQNNSLYLKGEKLPNKVSLELIHNEEYFQGLYNFWLTSSNRNWDDLKQNLVSALEGNGYPLTNDGFYIVSNKFFEDQELIYSYANLPCRYRNLFEDKLKLDEILNKLFPTTTKKLSKVFLTKAFQKGQINASYFFMAELLSPVMKLENVIKLFQESQTQVNNASIFSRIDNERFDNCKKFLEDNFKGKDSRIIKLLSGKNSFNGLIQSVALYEEIREKIKIDLTKIKYNSFEDLYNILSEESYKLRYPFEKIDVPKNFPAFLKNKKACSVGEHRIVYPKSNYDLIEWSSRMNNCIRGYTERANSPDCLILALMEGDEMIINMDLRKNSQGVWRIAQFKKYGNRGIESSDFAKDVFAHIEKEIINWKEPYYKKVNKKNFSFKESPINNTLNKN